MSHRDDPEYSAAAPQEPLVLASSQRNTCLGLPIDSEHGAAVPEAESSSAIPSSERDVFGLREPEGFSGDLLSERGLDKARRHSPNGSAE